MVATSLTSFRYWDIGENRLNWVHLRHNRRFSQKQNDFIDVFTMVHHISDRHIQAVMNNLKFIILDYLAAKKSGILDWRRDFCDWSISSHSIWKVMPSKHLTEYNTLRDIALHFTRKLNTYRPKPWCGGVPSAVCSTWYATPVCDAIIVSTISRMLRADATVVIIILKVRWWSWARACVASECCRIFPRDKNPDYEM